MHKDWAITFQIKNVNININFNINIDIININININIRSVNSINLLLAIQRQPR